MPRSYASEFPDFTASDIPAEFLDATQWVDTSWHNDACPRFYSVATLTHNGEPARVCVWVEKPDADDRENPSFPRFGVELVTVDDCEQFPTDTSVDCENIAQVWVAIASFAASVKMEAIALEFSHAENAIRVTYPDRVDDCEQFSTDTSIDCDTIAHVWAAIASFAAPV